LVVSTTQAGARLLVSGVEELDTSPEDSIVHISSPVPGRGNLGARFLVSGVVCNDPEKPYIRFFSVACFFVSFQVIMASCIF
jgi:hypothetical protein